MSPLSHPKGGEEFQEEIGHIKSWLYVLGGMLHPGSDWGPE